MILRLRYITILIDYLLLLAGFTLAYFVRVGFIFSSDLPLVPYLYSALIAAVIWIISLVVFRGYSPAVRLTRPVQLLKVLIAAVVGTATYGLIYYFGQKTLFSRLLLIYIFLFGSALLILCHVAMQAIQRQLNARGYGITRLLMVGSNRGVQSFISTLKKNHSSYVPVAVLDGHGTSQKEIGGVPVLGKLNILESTVEKYQIEAIVQGDNIEQVVNIHSFCQQHGLNYYLLPYLFGAYQGQLQVSILEKPVINPMGEPQPFLAKLLG